MAAYLSGKGVVNFLLVDFALLFGGEALTTHELFRFEVIFVVAV
jgi:hypothetical protein